MDKPQGDEYLDRHNNPIQEGLYVSYPSDRRAYFKIEHPNPQTGWIFTSSTNPQCSNSLTSLLASKLTPLLAPRLEAKDLRLDADWLEQNS